MIPESIVLGQILAPLIAGLVALILYEYIGREYLGAAENEYWNKLRIGLLSAGDSKIRKKTDFALTNTATDEEFVGAYDITSLEVAQTFEDAGYLQGVLSGLKYRPPEADPNEDDVLFESGSMVYRESKSDLVPDALALRQVHVFWFQNENGGVDVYAHEEYSSLNPLVAWKHYKAKTQNPSLGIERARKVLQ